ncbi:Uu.00g021690.m01.CDS01 [Anthostomella pinea]|uniref:Uu.00g021690.m01.CDS01 n=1 Tax=Anthostomella pinea TaxID=933095 RepID=A0AAI8W088_9PEZI|nr:Uu.00g021690.m01.CDS01 [Anthostomella pinea]
MSLSPRMSRAFLASSRRVGASPLTCAMSSIVNPSIAHRSLHAAAPRCAVPATKPTNPDPRENPAHELAPAKDENVGRKRFADFELKVYCLDRAKEPSGYWAEAERRVVPECGGCLRYRQQDVQDVAHLDQVITEIADENQRLDGVVAAAGIQQVTPAVVYNEADATRMLSVNYVGVLMAATAASRQMMKYKCHGSICLIAMDGGHMSW